MEDKIHLPSLKKPIYTNVYNDLVEMEEIIEKKLEKLAYLRKKL